MIKMKAWEIKYHECYISNLEGLKLKYIDWFSGCPFQCNFSVIYNRYFNIFNWRTWKSR